MGLVAKKIFSNIKDHQLKVSFNDGLTFNIEFDEYNKLRLYRSRKYAHTAFRSQNHERAAIYQLANCNMIAEVFENA